MASFERFEYLEIGEVTPGCTDSSVAANRRSAAGYAGGAHLILDQVIGGHGSAIGEFNSPCGLAVDSHGSIYVADAYNHRVQRVSPGGEVLALGGRGSIPGRFLNPQDLAIGPDRSLFVLEQGNSRIQKIAPDGCIETVIGQEGARRGDFCHPMGLAVDSSGCIYVADTGNGRLQKLDPTGSPIYCVSSLRDRRLFGPQGVEVDSSGNCLVADTFSHCVVKFDRDGNEIGRFGVHGRRRGDFDEPQDLALDTSCRLYVIEMGNSRVQVFGPGDDMLGAFDGSPASGGLKSPTGIAVGPAGEIYVSDTMNHRILRLNWSAD